MITFQCMRCSNKIGVPDAYRGKRISCPKCSGLILIPGIPGTLAGPAIEVARPTGAPGSPRVPSASARPAQLNVAAPDVLESSATNRWLDQALVSKQLVVVSLLIIAFGGAWLLNALHIVQGLQWFWTGGLFVASALTFVLGGFTKHTYFIGTFICIMGVFSILRQTGIVGLEVEVPCLVVSFGVLLLIVTLCGYFLPNLVGEETGSQSPA